MEGYKERLIVERDLLTERVEKLKAKLEEKGFKEKIGEEKTFLLNLQYCVMIQYEYILNKRLELEGIK